MYPTHVCGVCGNEWQQDSVPTENEVCEKCYEKGYRIPLRDEDLVTGTPIKPKAIKDIPVWFNKNIEIFKIFQRAVMMILTTVLVVAILRTGTEIQALRKETARIATIAEAGVILAETTRQEVLREIDEIQKNGIDFHIKLW